MAKATAASGLLVRGWMFNPQWQARRGLLQLGLPRLLLDSTEEVIWYHQSVHVFESHMRHGGRECTEPSGVHSALRGRRVRSTAGWW